MKKPIKYLIILVLLLGVLKISKVIEGFGERPRSPSKSNDTRAWAEETTTKLKDHMKSLHDALPSHASGNPHTMIELEFTGNLNKNNSNGTYFDNTINIPGKLGDADITISESASTLGLPSSYSHTEKLSSGNDLASIATTLDSFKGGWYRGRNSRNRLIWESGTNIHKKWH